VTVPEYLDLREIEQFVYREARYADEHDYDAWKRCGPTTPCTGCRPGETWPSPAARCR
jgi:hypothetical protein